jgi:hypothetical protein
MQPEVISFANKLGVGVSDASYPAPAVAAPVLRFSLLTEIVQNVDHKHVSRQIVLAAIDSCIGAANSGNDESVIA